MTFENLNIIAPILKALKDKNYTEPTLIQEKAIPLILKKNDIMGSAQTGTGKTAAFAIPIIQIIENENGNRKRKPQIRTLIITPTRELAIQIDDNIRRYSRYTGIRHAVIFGGVNQINQVRKLRRGVHILVATPGRLLDLIDQGIISLARIKEFVLDEADTMFDMGFIHDIKKVLRMLPEDKQSLFFSATMPRNIIDLARKILKNPEKIIISPDSSTAETVQQYVYYTNRSSKKDLLIHILQNLERERVLLFSKTKHGADKITEHLKRNKVKSAAIHGNKPQRQRQRVLKQFKDDEIRVLVATDIAARGIDIDKLKYVINYDIPNVTDSYIHRIGRSGRAGEQGNAISISEPEENYYIKDIERSINKKITVIADNPYPQTEKPKQQQGKGSRNRERSRRGAYRQGNPNTYSSRNRDYRSGNRSYNDRDNQDYRNGNRSYNDRDNQDYRNGNRSYNDRDNQDYRNGNRSYNDRDNQGDRNYKGRKNNKPRRPFKSKPSVRPTSSKSYKSKKY